MDYKVDDKNWLFSLFWEHGNSRRDYMTFSEIVAFNTTYKTNDYNEPLIALIGVNYHFEMCIFRLTLLINEI